MTRKWLKLNEKGMKFYLDYYRRRLEELRVEAWPEGMLPPMPPIFPPMPQFSPSDFEFAEEESSRFEVLVSDLSISEALKMVCQSPSDTAARRESWPEDRIIVADEGGLSVGAGLPYMERSDAGGGPWTCCADDLTASDWEVVGIDA